jgi:hypothetical protein
MRYTVTICVTAVLLAASAWIWLYTPPVFWGSILSEFQLLLPFAAVVVFLSLANWLSALVGKEH